MSVEIKDTNNIPKYEKMIKDLVDYKIQIGIFGENGSDILMIANVNEFGCDIKVTPEMRAFLHSIDIHLKKETKSIKIPERSFIREGFDKKVNKIEKSANKLLKNVLLLKMDTKTLYEVLGDYIVGEIQDYMVSIKTPKNHPSTIKQKGSSNPLIDTGRLKDSIAFKVVKR